MYEHTFDKTLKTPVVAKLIARWSLEHAQETRKARHHALVCTKIFTCFMLEGVIYHLGENFIKNWKKIERNKTLLEKHELIKTEIDLKTPARFRTASRMIKNLVEFRHQFAHPKEIKRSGTKLYKKMPDHAKITMPLIAWEVDLDLNKIAKEYDSAVRYCDYLLKQAAKHLRESYKSDFMEAHKKYPDLVDYEYVARMLEHYINSTAHASSSLSFTKLTA